MIKRILSTSVFLLFLLGINSNYQTITPCDSSIYFQRNRQSRNIISTSAGSRDVTGIGYSIDAAKSSFIDPEQIKTNAEIFDPNWLSTKIDNGIFVTINGSDTKTSSATTISSFMSSFSANLSLNNSITLGKSIFTAGLSTGFQNTTTFKYNEHASQYFYHLNSVFKRYTFSLPNTTDLTNYKANLSSSYVSALSAVFSGTKSVEDFYRDYGTHVIAKGTYGGSCTVYYSVISNQISLDTTTATTITSALKAGIEDALTISGESSMSFNLSTALNKSENTYQEQLVVNAKGGQSFSCFSFNSFSNTYFDWYRTIDDAPTLISAQELIPLWDLLPSHLDNSSNKQTLINGFSNYVDANSINMSIYAKKQISSSPKTSTFITRPDYERIINDSGVYNNHYDKLDLTSSGYGPRLLKENGFKYATIELQLLMAEINAGYQEIYLYSNENEETAFKLGEVNAYELGGGSLVKTFEDITFVFNKIPLDRLKDEELLVIRYGAHGDGADDWKNKNIRVKITYSVC